MEGTMPENKHKTARDCALVTCLRTLTVSRETTWAAAVAKSPNIWRTTLSHVAPYISADQTLQSQTLEREASAGASVCSAAGEVGRDEL
jgi:hypothetical protein